MVRRKSSCDGIRFLVCDRVGLDLHSGFRSVRVGLLCHVSRGIQNDLGLIPLCRHGGDLISFRIVQSKEVKNGLGRHPAFSVAPRDLSVRHPKSSKFCLKGNKSHYVHPKKTLPWFVNNIFGFPVTDDVLKLLDEF
ncbi:MAG: hypothetical protein BWZ03_00766 [bacterium ADurb.BinA186]|nr:MAG: hypothetical protein BWZ03_00766 [bacterium ADurb.BinA186]